MVPKQEGGATNKTEPNERYPWQPCEQQPPIRHSQTDKSVEKSIFTTYLPRQEERAGRE